MDKDLKEIDIVKIQVKDLRGEQTLSHTLAMNINLDTLEVIPIQPQQYFKDKAGYMGIFTPTAQKPFWDIIVEIKTRKEENKVLVKSLEFYQIQEVYDGVFYKTPTLSSIEGYVDVYKYLGWKAIHFLMKETKELFNIEEEIEVEW